MFPVSNDLIAKLRPSDQQLLIKHTRLIELKVGDVLSSPHANDPLVYFLDSGSVALFVSYKTGQMNAGLALGLVGREGVLGLQAAFGLGAGNLSLIVQSHGYAHMLEAHRLRLLIQRHPDWVMLFSRSLWTMFQDIARLAALSHAHDIKRRLADWLLMSQQRCEQVPMFMTHAHIARMLGVRRASITLAARQLKLTGLIEYSRGNIYLKNKPALQALAST